MAEQLFASFILDRSHGLEIAIEAGSVTEATPITGNIQPLPASVPFLEGIMHLRDAAIPVLNLKKRLGLETTRYEKDAKIAVVTLADQPFGLLFDDIREVLRVDDSLLVPVQPALQSEGYIISALITLQKEHRTLEVLDLKRLFPESSLLAGQADFGKSKTDSSVTRTYSRYVIFKAAGLEYGVSVDHSREITFLSDIDTVFKNGCLEGALQLRGHTVPVLHAGTLLKGGRCMGGEGGEMRRILVMSADSFQFGMIIDEIREILTVVNEEILPMPMRADQAVIGIYEPVTGRNIMLLDVQNLIAAQMEELKSMARISNDVEEEEQTAAVRGRHLITENCYLIFSIGRFFAIELKDVQEIIECNALLSIPSASGFSTEVLNLRGRIIPVINLREFYGYPEKMEKDGNFRLIICRDGQHVIALQVDSIATIYKQEQFYATPSLNSQLQPRQDTLDRLIEFVGESQVTEHVLVVNTRNLINNHLRQVPPVAHQGVQYTEIEREDSPIKEI